MLCQEVINHVGQQRGDQQEKVDTQRIREYVRINPPSLNGSSIIEDLDNFVEELKKVFDVMHVVDAKRVELNAFQLKNVARTWFDQLKEGRDKDAPLPSQGYFEEAFLGH